MSLFSFGQYPIIILVPGAPLFSASTKNRNLWASGLVQHRKSAIHGLPVRSDKSDWLRIRNANPVHAQKIGLGKRLPFRVLTNRSTASWDENAPIRQTVARPAPRIATSGLLGWSNTGGLPVRSDKSDWLRIRTVLCLDCQPIRLKLERLEFGKSRTFQLTNTTVKLSRKKREHL